MRGRERDWHTREGGTGTQDQWVRWGDWHTRAKDWWAGEAGVRERGQVGEREGPVGERWAGGHETSAKLDIRL